MCRLGLACFSKAAAMSSSNCPTKNQIPIPAKPNSVTSKGRLGWSGSPSQRYDAARTGAAGRFASTRRPITAGTASGPQYAEGSQSQRLATLNLCAPEFVNTIVIVNTACATGNSTLKDILSHYESSIQQIEWHNGASADLQTQSCWHNIPIALIEGF